MTMWRKKRLSKRFLDLQRVLENGKKKTMPDVFTNAILQDSSISNRTPLERSVWCSVIISHHNKKKKDKTKQSKGKNTVKVYEL